MVDLRSLVADLQAAGVGLPGNRAQAAQEMGVQVLAHDLAGVGAQKTGIDLPVRAADVELVQQLAGQPGDRPSFAHRHRGNAHGDVAVGAVAQVLLDASLQSGRRGKLFHCEGTEVELQRLRLDDIR